MSLEMPVTALVPWFGSKRNLAPVIVEELGPHKAYWSLFCGSAADLFAKEPCTMETVNDMHGGLINLARVVQDSKLAEQLFAKSYRTMLAKDLFIAATKRLEKRRKVPNTKPDPDWAYDYLLVSWFGRNGVAGTRSYNNGFCVRYTKNGGHAAKRWCSAVESIPAWCERLRQVTVLNEDAFPLLERIEDAPGTAIYLDPPYLIKGAKYVYDFASEVPVSEAIADGDGEKPCKRNDHVRLAARARRFRHTRVVVSYYDHPNLELLYPGWSMRKINVSKALAHQGSRGKNDARAVEVLLTNGPCFGGQEGRLF